MRLFSFLLLVFLSHAKAAQKQTNFILVMADDQGWGQTGYYKHPVLKTPNLDEMASKGLRFDRFYAGGPVCSPTRATVLTGRTHDRTGVFDHGYALRKQEKTLPQAMKKAGYATGHFGKWHLNGLRGPGVPILPDDPNGPKGFGFDLVACPNYFFEVMSWIGFSIMTNVAFSYLFTLFGFYQMSIWAQGKHKNYKKTYEKEYTSLNRKAIIPFIY